MLPGCSDWAICCALAVILAVEKKFPCAYNDFRSTRCTVCRSIELFAYFVGFDLKPRHSVELPNFPACYVTLFLFVVQAISWLTTALSVSCSGPITTGKGASVDLARIFTRRAPYETKPVLLAVKEAVDAVAIKRRTGNRSSTTGQRVSERGARSVGWQAVASLAEVSSSAISSSLLPLPVPQSSPALLVERCARGGESGREGPRAKGRRRQSVPSEGGMQKCHPSAMAVTAGLLLDAFVQRPEVTIRAIRRAVQGRSVAMRIPLCGHLYRGF